MATLHRVFTIAHSRVPEGADFDRSIELETCNLPKIGVKPNKSGFCIIKLVVSSRRY